MRNWASPFAYRPRRQRERRGWCTYQAAVGEKRVGAYWKNGTRLSDADGRRSAERNRARDVDQSDARTEPLLRPNCTLPPLKVSEASDKVPALPVRLPATRVAPLEMASGEVMEPEPASVPPEATAKAPPPFCEPLITNAAPGAMLYGPLPDWLPLITSTPPLTLVGPE